MRKDSVTPPHQKAHRPASTKLNRPTTPIPPVLSEEFEDFIEGYRDERKRDDLKVEQKLAQQCAELVELHKMWKWHNDLDSLREMTGETVDLRNVRRTVRRVRRVRRA